jgi:hypothetical protein
MGKKVIRLTESDLEKIVERVINEQTEQEKKTKGVQEFLNLKKITGYNKKPLDVDGITDNMLQSQTAQAISNLQSRLGIYPADGVWGEKIWSKLPPEDVKKLKELIANQGGFIDMLLNKFRF